MKKLFILVNMFLISSTCYSQKNMNFFNKIITETQNGFAREEVAGTFEITKTMISLSDENNFLILNKISKNKFNCVLAHSATKAIVTIKKHKKRKSVTVDYESSTIHYVFFPNPTDTNKKPTFIAKVSQML